MTSTGTLEAEAHEVLLIVPNRTYLDAWSWMSDTLRHSCNK